MRPSLRLGRPVLRPRSTRWFEVLRQVDPQLLEMRILELYLAITPLLALCLLLVCRRCSRRFDYSRSRLHTACEVKESGVGASGQRQCQA